MPSARVTAAILLAAALTGCAVGPGWHAPAAPRDVDYAPQSLGTLTSGSGAAAQHLVAGRDIPAEWWTLFQSEALTSLVKRSLEANPTITAAQASLREAQELVRAQRGFFFPTVAATFQAERHKVSGNTNGSQTIGVQGSGLNKLPQIPETPASLNTFPHNLPSYYTFYTSELSVGFAPDVLGSNRRQVESLAAQAEVQHFALEAAYITLASNVVAAAIQEAAVRAQIQATEQIIEAETKSLGILQQQLRLGFAMRIDVAAQETALAQTTATLAPLQKQLEQSLDLIRALTGGLPTQATEGFDLDALTLPPELPLSLPGKIIVQRPDVRAAEAQLRGANANVGVAIAAMLPQFSLTGQYGGNATQVSQMFAAGGPFWSVYGNASQPLFQGGALLHQERGARAALMQAAAQYQSTVITAYQNVADALHVLLSDADLLAADVEAENAAKVVYDLSLRQLQAGFVPALTFLSAQQMYNQALRTRVQAQAARLGDTVALFQALGGGWWNRQALAAQ
jgi:NodT family efflux transporter outer membrane factor (OMF) lipoprotein